MESSEGDPGGYYIISEIVGSSWSFGMIVSFLVIALLLVMSALISGAEVAFFSIGPVAKKELEDSSRRSGKAILALLEMPKRLLATILVANNLANVATIILSSYVASALFTFGEVNAFGFRVDLGFLIEVFVITFLIVLIGEIIPKVYATRHAISLASIMAYPLLFMERLFRPVSWILISSTSFIDKRIKRHTKDLSVDDLSHALELTSGEETTEEEQKILSGIVRFGNIDVKQIMKSRVDVVALEENTLFNDVITTLVDAGYSRIPVYKENFDNISGVLYVKDLLPYLSERPDFNWQHLLRKPFFVPESKKIDDLLKEFQSSKIHLAIVVDEYGGTRGIVTLEDIIEEIVGEISDEFDEEELVYSKLDDNNYVFEGKIALNDMCRVMEISEELFAEFNSDTLAGAILEQEGKIPEKNTEITYKHFTFRVESVNKRRIIRVKVTVNEMPGEGEAGNGQNGEEAGA